MEVATKKDIRQLSLKELEAILTEKGEKKFRSRQVYEWLWKKSARSFEEMTNLSKELRKYLSENYAINAVKIDLEQQSLDGTVKYRFRLYDGYLIEGVLIPSPDESRMTACISSQVGCSLACKFCATGLLPRERNVTAGEMYDQVVLINQAALKYFERPLSNIVYMGMGEPLLNYKEVMQSIDFLTLPEGLNRSPKRITVSTAGIAKMIKKLADDNSKVNLALSLHAANDEKRNTIMEINQSNSLEVLAEALNYYYQQTKQKVTYEYIAFHNFNDGISDAKDLVAFCKNIPCKVNIIEYNPVAGLDFQKSKVGKLERFKNYLEQKGITTTIRRSRGKDIDAACGQLANK